MSVTIIGGGWAGLAAAVTLTERGVPVTLIEASKQLGGRARCAPFNNHQVDNGQHIMIGAYSATLNLLRTIGLPEERVLLRHPLMLSMTEKGRNEIVVRGAKLPAPLNLLAGLVTARGFSVMERASAIRFCIALALRRFHVPLDISVEALLIRYRQTGRLLKALWEPLCIATLNTPIKDASAKVFLRVLQDSFSHRREDSDLLIPKLGLCQILPIPASDFIEQRGGKIALQTRATDLLVENNRVSAVKTDEEYIPADHVIIATAPNHAAPLLEPIAECHSLAELMSRFDYQPITTVYLQYESHLRMPAPMMGTLGGVSQWVFDRGSMGQDGLLAVVISADGEHMQLDNDTLCDTVAKEISQLFPAFSQPLATRAIREKRATFSCKVNIDTIRPANPTPLPNCHLAGDYTATGYPATLEGAVRSGMEAARLVLREIS